MLPRFPAIQTRSLATREQLARDRHAVGMFTPQAAGLLVLTACGLFWHFQHKKEELRVKRIKEMKSQKIGRARVGGPFKLHTQDGAPFTHEDLLGKWSLVYFGFTNCPDVCPDELDKMGVVVDTIDKQGGPPLQPIFISCDPARDTNNAIKDYLSDFHPRMVGLTGTYDEVKATCKAYRVYFSTPPDVQPGEDYIVDHSIYFYLMNPEGEFVDAFGKDRTADDVVKRVEEAVADFEKEYGSKV